MLTNSLGSRYFYLLFVCLLLLPVSINAQAGSCNSSGFTVLTINGIFTDEVDAKGNKDTLKRQLPAVLNNQSIVIDYLWNPSHVGGFGDIVKAIKQKFFDSETVDDYDLGEMHRAASEKVATQKLLLVAHSQGNFYANSLYDVLTRGASTGDGGGVPAQSLGVYGVATPSGRIAGGGQWLTSDTDAVIAGIVARTPFRTILEPNTHIVLGVGDDVLGHSFSDVYLKHRAVEIVQGIQRALDRLQTNNVQAETKPCIVSPMPTVAKKLAGIAFRVVDPPAGVVHLALQVSARAFYSGGTALASLVRSVIAQANQIFAKTPPATNTALVFKVVEAKPATVAVVKKQVASVKKLVSAPVIVQVPPLLITFPYLHTEGNPLYVDKLSIPILEPRPLAEMLALVSAIPTTSEAITATVAPTSTTTAVATAVTSMATVATTSTATTTDNTYQPGFGGGGGVAIVVIVPDPEPEEDPGPEAVATAPGAPTDLVASRGSGSAELIWQAPVGDGGSALTDYVIHVSTDNFATNDSTFADGVSTATATTVTGLTNGTTYTFRIVAQNGVGTSTPSATASATPAGVPAAITTLAVTSVGETSVTLSWSVPAANGAAITGYQVLYSDNNFTATSTFSGAINSASTEVTGLTTDVAYSFKVLAINTVGTSSDSNVVADTPFFLPDLE